MAYLTLSKIVDDLKRKGVKPPGGADAVSYEMLGAHLLGQLRAHGYEVFPDRHNNTIGVTLGAERMLLGRGLLRNKGVLFPLTGIKRGEQGQPLESFWREIDPAATIQGFAQLPISVRRTKGTVDATKRAESASPNLEAIPTIPPATATTAAVATPKPAPETSGGSSTKMLADLDKPWPDSDDGLWTLGRLAGKAAASRQWIIKPLIEEGDQVVLAGEPKCGKSMLASQLAIEIASGPGRLRMSAPRENQGASVSKDKQKAKGEFMVVPNPRPDSGGKWRVLYVSFEMGPRAVLRRVKSQIASIELNPPDAAQELSGKIPAEPQDQALTSDLPLVHLFQLAGNKSLCLTSNQTRGAGLGSNNACETEWRNKMKSFQPDLIVFDSLSQLHGCDENSNQEMRDVMHSLRKWSRVQTGEKNGEPTYRYVAHVIIHHQRKDSPDQHYSRKGAASMRGASSIHAEADLAISITTRKHHLILTFSARHIERPDDLCLSKDERGIFVGMGAELMADELYLNRLTSLLQPKERVSVEEVARRHGAAAPKFRADKSAWQKQLTTLLKKGLLVRESKDGERGYFYGILDSAAAPEPPMVDDTVDPPQYLKSA